MPELTPEEIDKYLESKKNAETLYSLIYSFIENNEVTVWDLSACLEQVKYEQLLPEDDG